MKPGRMVRCSSSVREIAALLGLGLLAGAAGVGWLNFQQRDEGYFTTQPHRFDDIFCHHHRRAGRHGQRQAAGRHSFGNGRQHPAPRSGSQPGQGDIHWRRNATGCRALSRGRQAFRDPGTESAALQGRLHRSAGDADPCPPRTPELLGGVRRRHRHAGTQMGHPPRQMDRGGHECGLQRPGLRGSPGRSSLRPALAALPVAAHRGDRLAGHRCPPDCCRRHGAGTARAAAALSPVAVSAGPVSSRPLSAGPSPGRARPARGNPDGGTSCRCRRHRAVRQRRHAGRRTSGRAAGSAPGPWLCRSQLPGSGVSGPWLPCTRWRGGRTAAARRRRSPREPEVPGAADRPRGSGAVPVDVARQDGSWPSRT